MSVPIPEADEGVTGRTPGTTGLVTTGGSPYHGGRRTDVETAELRTHHTNLNAAADLVDALETQLAALDADIEVSGQAHQVLHHFGDVRVRLGELRWGPNGLRPLAEELRQRASDVFQQSLVYDAAEAAVVMGFSPPLSRRILYQFPLMPPGTDQLQMLEDMAEFARAAGFAYANMRFNDIPDGLMLQSDVANFARQMQYMNSDVVRNRFFYDGEHIDVEGLTPTQRSALVGLSWLSMVQPWNRNRDDVVVTPSEVSAPPVVVDPNAPFGPQTTPTILGTEAATPRSVRDVLSHVDEVNRYIDSRGGDAAIEIQRTTTSGGEHRWTVYIPGTRAPLSTGGPNPMDMETNLLGIAGERTDMEIAVAQALRQLNVPPDEPVNIVGHSQGGIVGTRVAADPVLQSQYTFSTVVTAGSPTGTTDGVPSDVQVLHLEDSQDPVVGLDGEQNEPAPNRVTVTALSEEPSGLGEHHHLAQYVDMAEQLDDYEHPAVRRFMTMGAEAMALDDAGATTRSYVFDVQRR